MPNLDHTKSFGQGPSTGRRRAWCAKNVTVQATPSETKSEETKEVLYGVGRGGRPYGGGRGYCHGGPHRKNNKIV